MSHLSPPPTALSVSAKKRSGLLSFSLLKLPIHYLMALLVVSIFSPSLNAQQQAALLFENATQQGVQEAFYKNNITKSANNFIYTAGASLNASGNYDIIVTKHTNANVEVWTQIWSNTAYEGLDMAADLTIDSNGDIIVVGTTQLSLTNYDAVVVKYSTAGVLLWSQTFNGTISGPDGFVTVLASGTDIYCGGSVLNNVLQQQDAMAIKYNGSGIQQWSHTYNSVNNLRDGHNRIAASGSNVIFYGGVQTAANPIAWTMVRVELNASTGAQINANLSNNVSATFTQITDIDIDAQDNIYIAGHVNTPQGKDLKVVKLVSMAVSWSFVYNGVANLDDEAHCIDVSGSFVYVAGSTTSAANGKDLYAVKIPLAGPPVTWQKIIDHAQGDDVFTALNIDPSGQLYLAGSAHKVNNLDLCIYKLDYTNGNVLASNTYNNDYNGDDYATGVAIDEAGNVFVAGQMEVAPQSFKYNLVKWAQKTVYLPVVSYSSSGGYAANVSQLRNANGSSNEYVLYYNQQNRVATYLDDAKLMYQLIQGSDSTNADTTFRVDMRFTKGNTNQKVYALKTRKEYHNYYLGHMLRKGERTPSYNGIWKQSVYTNTDVLYTNGPSGCKQYLIARSGAPTGDFEMTFDGQTNLSIAANGNLIIATTIGQIEYAKPKAYSMNLTTGALTLHSWQPSYFISNNKVSFSGIGSWGGALVLEVGEPSVSSSSQQVENVDWSTMFGGNGADQFKDVQSNAENEAFAIGESNSAQITDQIGENIVPHNNERDVILVKFDEVCTAEYLTYFGGSNQDYASALDIMPNNGDIHLVGATSSNDLQTLSDNEMEDASLDGLQDGFYAKFNASGLLEFHTYVGGDGSDNCTDIAVDFIAPFNLPIIYYVGHTNSGNGWAPLVTGPNSQNMPYSGGIDGFYFKRSGPDELITHSTFFGSNQNDWFTGVDLFKASPVIVGITNESNYSANSQMNMLPTDGLFPKAHSPFYGSEFLSNNNTISHNYFVTWFGDDGTVPNQFFDRFRWCTYFSPANDGAFYLSKGVIATDNEGLGMNDKGDVFLSGQLPTTDLTFPFTVQGWHQSTPGLAGTSDAFLMKFRLASDNSILIRATLFGGDGDEYGSGFAIDPNHNVFLCGQSYVNSIQQTADWCSSPIDGAFPMCDHNDLLYTEENIVGANNRAFVCAFRSDGEMLWSTQYGYGQNNAAHAMCASNDKVWMVGYSFQDWTFENYIPESENDYFREVDPSLQLQEATIARFDIPLILSDESYNRDQQNNLALYPNPNDGHFILENKFTMSSVPFELSIFNVLGEVVHKQLVMQRQSSLNLSHLAPGCYHVLIQANGNGSSTKFIINQ